jgi:prepilin-type N-terminal cleavage/methylation domain-containing protein
MPVNHRCRSWQRNPARGFTLLELAVVMVIIGLLLAIWSYTVPWIDEEGARERTRAIMEEANQSLLAFARTNHRLPCPDTNNDGVEGGVGGCQAADVTGTVPHETLLLSAPVQDAHHVPVAYTLYRNPVAGADLGRLVNRIDTMDDVDGANNVTGTLNVCDFCEALRNGNPTAGSGFASTSIQNTTGGCGGGVLLNQAYVLASSGFEDRDGDSLLFDGDNATAPPTCFASPSRGRSSEYDDIVVAISFNLLIGELCRSPVCLGPNPVFP